MNHFFVRCLDFHVVDSVVFFSGFFCPVDDLHPKFDVLGLKKTFYDPQISHTPFLTFDGKSSSGLWDVCRLYKKNLI